MAGIITGKTNNVFDPQGTATRAEVSAGLKRFVELAIFSDTAQGWMMNDSGKWMYYEGGKAVTGNKIIAGRPYQFSATGELMNGSSTPETGARKSAERPFSVCSMWAIR